MEDVVLVLGYNNTRIKDVEKIQEKVARYLSALTILCKNELTEEDKCVCDRGIAVDLEGGEEATTLLLEECQKLNWRVIAILPFSDRGTQLGAHLAERLGLSGPDPETIAAALDKYIFRRYEAEAEIFPQHYRKLRAARVESWEALAGLYHEWGGKLFIKPMREGNSRGCQRIENMLECEAAWAALAPYRQDGIMVEELVDAAEEYSWDAVAGRVWITAKQTTNSDYRAEVQQIVPAPLSVETYNKLISAGFFMAELAGFRGGACHNEIFYEIETQEVMAVEPNLRPAGMRIWDLAALAYENFDPWREWILWAAGKVKAPTVPLRFRAYAGIRMIQATQTGTIQEITPLHFIEMKIKGVEILELQWTCAVGDNVNAEVKDNAGFLGYIVARCKNYENLTNFLQGAAAQLAQQVVIA